MSERTFSRRALLAGGGLLLATACTRSREGDGSTEPRSASAAVTLPPAAPYTLEEGEALPALKSAAAGLVQRLGTFSEAADPNELARNTLTDAGAPATSIDRIHQLLAPLLQPGAATASVIYPQIGGLVPLSDSATYASVMVVFEQRRATREGISSQSRVADIRLQRKGAAWRLDDVASLGGEPTSPRADLPEPVIRLLEHPGVQLPDSARWDLNSGVVDARVAATLARIADEVPLRVSVARSGHPYRVIDGRRQAPVSAHSLGRAMDVWSIGGKAVSSQRRSRDGAAFSTLARLVRDSSLRQIGSPRGWDIDGAGALVFSNAVHDDHLHLAV